MTSTAFWRAWAVWALSVAATAAALTYTAVHPLPPQLASGQGNGSDKAVVIVFIGSFATMGALLAWKRPHNPIGWLLSGAGLAYAVGVSAVLMPQLTGTSTMSDWFGWIWLVGLGLAVLAVLLFPTGTLPSPRWRPVGWAAGIGLACWAVGNAFDPVIFTGSPPERNPIGIAGAAGNVFKVMASVGGLLIAVSAVAAIVSVLVRYRRAAAAERAQLKWLVYAAGVIAAGLLAEMLAEQLLGPGNVSNNLQNAMTSGVVALVPLAIAVAVLRYRLYDIDRVISRTVAYAIVTGLLIGIYAGLVLLATGVLGLHSSVAVAAATLTAAALFMPLRRQVQHRVDRRFNRARYDAETTVAAFAARLKDAVDLDTVRADLTGVVHTTLEPAHISVWTSRPG